MKVIKISQTNQTTQTQENIGGEAIQNIQGEYINSFTKNYNRLMTTLDSSMGELKTMVNNLVSDNNFNDLQKTTEYYVGNDGNGGRLGELLDKMTDVQNKFNQVKKFIIEQPTPLEKSNTLDSIQDSMENVNVEI